ncbi:hypothetical protein REJC140_02179 [Pseudorhizobium endolithicum]|uniref:Uncharacterized protein n=1 Tax=Pseudorhizobium endolithicum TaxID=1191678 RepID=A0ABN7K1X7_9HYPH|nr:hypothetical protein [Pseudorhizobium endolithicum]CAD6424636.1 hypothetical protein REQ54_02645 [Rhizobium sp. Q54]CAD7054534.1 hypothetical protein REJC140_02179 [Pseudorhizobium endolithicum]
MLEEKIEEAVRTELKRQAEERPQELDVTVTASGLEAHGRIDLTALAAAIAGTVSGGP